MTIICHTSVSSFTGHTGNSCKKWFCLVSVPLGEGGCLWFLFQCCVVWSAACWDSGSKECAEMLALTSLRSVGVLGKQPWPYQVHMLFTEIRKICKRATTSCVVLDFHGKMFLWLCPPAFLGVSGWRRFLTTCSDGWVGQSSSVQGAWDLSARALFGSWTQTTGGFSLPGSWGSSSCGEAICFPFLFYFIGFAAGGFWFGSIFLNITGEASELLLIMNSY